MIKLAIFVPHIGLAGAENQTLYIFKLLDRDEFDVNLITLSRGMEDRKNIPEKVTVLDKKPGIDINFIKELAGTVREIKPQLLHCISYTANFWGLLVARFYGLDTIAVSIWGEEWGLNNFQKYAIKYLIKNAAGVSVNSKGLIPYVEGRYGISGENIYVLPNGVDSDRFKMREKDRGLTRGLGVGVTEYVVGWVGNNRPEKDFDTFLKASMIIADRYEGVRFLVVGEDRMKPTIQERCEEKGIDDRFIITGKVFDIEKYYNLMDVYVCSSLSEGMSNALIEAQASGIPSISTDVPGANQIIDENETGYIVERGDYRSISERVSFLLDSDDIREEMGKKACKIASKRFNMAEMVRNYERFYIEVLENK